MRSKIVAAVLQAVGLVLIAIAGALVERWLGLAALGGGLVAFGIAAERGDR